MHQLLIDAIHERRIVTFAYDGERRMVEPHCYGQDSKGHRALRAFQLGKGWRLFHVSEAWGLQATDERFPGPRPGYRRGDRHMQAIFAQL